MARFTEVLRRNTPPQHLVELVDALNTASPTSKSGDRLLHGLAQGSERAARRAVPARSRRASTRSNNGSRPFRGQCRPADNGRDRRQIGSLGDASGERRSTGCRPARGAGTQLVAAWTRPANSFGLAKLYSTEPAYGATPDFDAWRHGATRTAAAVQRNAPAPDSSLRSP